MVVREGRKQQTTWQDVRPAQTRPKTPPAKQRNKHFRVDVQAWLHSPVIQRLHSWLLELPRKKLILIVFLVAVVLITVFTSSISLLSVREPNQEPQIAPETPVVSAGLVPGTPDFTILLPAGKSVQDLGGGWVRDASHPLFIYIDKIDDVPISVNEQPLPDEFKTDTEDQVEQLAKSEKSNEKITVGDTTVYIGTSGKGPQSVFFSRADLLILIKSADKIKSDQWAQYINSLQ